VEWGGGGAVERVNLRYIVSTYVNTTMYSLVQLLYTNLKSNYYNKVDIFILIRLEEALPYYKGQFALLKIQFQLNLPKT
jgi:hypothetical protein